MANNYAQFSEMIEGLTPEAVEWVETVLALDYDKPEDLEKLKKELSLESDDPRFLEELDSWPHFGTRLEGAKEVSLWLYSDEAFSDQHLIWFVQALINKFLPADYVFTATFACTCSKLRVGEFGGYWMAISKNDIRSGNTWDVAQNAAKQYRIDHWLGEWWMGKKVREVSGAYNLWRTGTVVEVIADENSKLHCKINMDSVSNYFWCPAAYLIIAPVAAAAAETKS